MLNDYSVELKDKDNLIKELRETIDKLVQDSLGSRKNQDDSQDLDEDGQPAKDHGGNDR